MTRFSASAASEDGCPRTAVETSESPRKLATVSEFPWICYIPSVTALPGVPNVLRLEYKTTDGADLDVLNRSYWSWAGTTPTVAILDAMATQAATSWDSRFVGLYMDQIALVETTLVDLTSDTSAAGLSTASYTGTLGGDVLPANTAFLNGYEIARRYRGGKPKNFWQFGNASKLQTTQTWTSAWVADVSGQIALWVTDMLALASGGTTVTGQVNVSYYGPPNIAVYNPVTKRYRTVSTVRATPIVDPIIGYTYSALIASQRRRSTRKR